MSMKKDKQYKLDIIPGIVLAAFSIFYMLQIPKVRVFKSLGATPLTNHFVPYLWGGCMLALSLWLVIRGVMKYNRLKKQNALPPSESFFAVLWDKREVVFSFIALALYVGFMESIGFVITTCIYTFVQILILTPRERWAKNFLPALIIALVTGFLLFYVFKVMLNVLLPVGIYGMGL
ncbi:MAG: tripartite tricarboxylate transporter TctB family protein [Synergistaceae bacterium]|nr:tripartite tricarboxylate transporter TctB family protein [Synergistaceae bacterium]